MSTEKLNKVKKPFYKKWWVWVIAVFIAVGIAGGGEEEDALTEAEKNMTAEEVDKQTEELAEEIEETVEEVTTEVEAEEPAAPEMTVSQKSAVQKAEAYISMGGFSKTGLIKQLEFEKFPKEDVAFAVDYLKIDYMEQAKIKAEAYMDMGGFSRDGLIKQLEFEGFTPEEATHGADEVGL